jgi:hypothetical protein
MKYLFFVLLLIVVSTVSGLSQSTFIIASDDAYVRAGTGASLNFDTATAGNGLRVRASATTDNWRKVYIKFDLSGYTDVVGNAKLSIWVDRAVGTGYNAITNPYADTARFYKVADDNWTESLITWNTAPVAGDYMFTEAFIHRTSTNPDTMYTWDVTQYVREEYAGDKKVTFLLIDADPATSGASLAINTTHGTDLRMYSLETPFFEPTLEISSTALPSITVSAPNGGENWLAGTTHDITWVSDLVSTVKIEYSTNNGSNWNTVAESVPASTASYSWLIPNTASKQCKIRISDSSNVAISDMSDGSFEITGANAPLVTTGSNDNITALSAHLYGTVNPNGMTASAWIDWGTSTSYGYRSSDTTLTGSASVPFDRGITGLLPNQTYHYRAAATNSDGTTYGDDQTFTTQPLCSGNCVIASDDAFIRGAQFADSNYNSFTIAGDALRIRASLADSNKRVSYLKFDLSGYSGEIGSAKLAIWVDRVLGSSNQDTASLYKVADDNWSESTITWNNAPVMGEYMLSQIFKYRTSSDPDTLYQWDVTSYVQTEFAGDKKVSFMLADTNTLHATDIRIYSHETVAFEPTLVISTPTGVNETNGMPQTISLDQNYPNPFNPSTTIRYTVPSTQQVRLEVYDVLGRLVANLVNERQIKGEYSINVNSDKLVSGVYFYKLIVGGHQETKRMMLIK